MIPIPENERPCQSGRSHLTLLIISGVITHLYERFYPIFNRRGQFVLDSKAVGQVCESEDTGNSHNRDIFRSLIPIAESRDIVENVILAPKTLDRINEPVVVVGSQVPSYVGYNEADIFV